MIDIGASMDRIGTTSAAYRQALHRANQRWRDSAAVRFSSTTADPILQDLEQYAAAVQSFDEAFRRIQSKLARSGI